MKTGDKMENCKCIYWYGGARVQVGFVPTFYFPFSVLNSRFPFPSPHSPLPVARFPLPILVTSVERLWIATLTRPLSYQ